jgi:hypothetical protein
MAEPQLFDVLAHLFAWRDLLVANQELLPAGWYHRFVAPATFIPVVLAMLLALLSVACGPRAALSTPEEIILGPVMAPAGEAPVDCLPGTRAPPRDPPASLACGNSSQPETQPRWIQPFAVPRSKMRRRSPLASASWATAPVAQ